MNPLEWLGRFYGKFFVGHEIIGYLALCAVAALIIGVLWLMAIDKYHEEHPKTVKSNIPENSEKLKAETNSGDLRVPEKNADVAESMKDQSKAPEKSPVESNMAKEKKDSGRVINAPNSVISIDQRGGITAGQVNITTGLPEPKFEIKSLVENQPDGELYRTEFLLNISSQVAIPNLYLQVSSPAITKMDVNPQRSGASISGHTGIRDGFAFTNLQNAYGSYKITALSKSPSVFEVGVEPR